MDHWSPQQKLRMTPQWLTSGTWVDHWLPPVDCDWLSSRAPGYPKTENIQFG